MTRVYKAIAHVAPLMTSVLIQGETGTGKELVARAIHDAGGRSQGPYVAINCPSLPEGLLESELFGHVRGAFTGASADRPGLFEAAHEGTILLDEIGDMPLAVQAKLLRVLETSEVRRVGSSSVQRVDVRVLAATNRDLERAARSGEFREDLLYRLNAVTIHVPPLRERREDIPLLVQHFLRQFAGGSPRGVPQVSEVVRRHSWPGNVRELAHVIERAVALSRGMRIEAEDLPSVIRHGADRRSEVPANSLQTLDEVERAHILSVLKSVAGVRRRAAAILGIDRKTLYRKLLRYGLVEEHDEES
jgi:DNA-binding NtrC family response regulator